MRNSVLTTDRRTDGQRTSAGVELRFAAKNSQKWHFKAITAKSEENKLDLKFNFTSSRMSQKI